MAKAYDRLEWPFLLAVMANSPKWCSLVEACLANCWYSIAGGLHGYFKSGRGVRQGDPLSLF